MRWGGLVKLHLKLIHVIGNKFTAYDRAPCFSSNVNRQCPRVYHVLHSVPKSVLLGSGRTSCISCAILPFVSHFNMFQPHLYCQVSLETNSCDEEQVANVVPILLKVNVSTILKIGIYRIYDTPPCFPSKVNRHRPRVFQRSPMSSEICPVWTWKNKLHQLRHQCQKHLLFSN